MQWLKRLIRRIAGWARNQVRSLTPYEGDAALNWKELSETVQNFVSTAAIIVGGIWVLYQWDTMFPKTRSDVQSAAATVRTDVSGTFSVQLGLDTQDGGQIPFHLSGGSSEDSDITAYCLSHPSATITQVTPVYSKLKLQSASAIPVRARIEGIGVSTAPVEAAYYTPSSTAGAIVSDIPITPLASFTDDNMFFGGLRENRVETGQSVEIAMMFNAQIPFSCAQLERLIIFQADVSLTAIDPVKDRNIGPSVAKKFVSTCQLDPRTGAHCNVTEIGAFGQ